ncbi:hypothetical protein K432DRAFT_293314 [Lepidopterella palustris CBS 459.81]|uniref:Sensitive to high expression protein 9, mitochondrial n=1 Tax=Lepidopterella palustris CBS 459.81 TaxID=1314670 RepID=A0A8E2EEC4_9PEZI|nr:hypothetical protein K432DRAFT_293314 [Lepidopterella palustris CBS 459.81]
MLHHASRSLLEHAAFLVSPKLTKKSLGFLAESATSSSICLQCQFRAFSQRPSTKTYWPPSKSPVYLSRQSFSSSRIRFEKIPDSSQTSSPANPRQSTPPSTPEAQLPPKDEDNISRVPDEDLPSHREGQRWTLSKRMSELMDDLLPKLAILTQKVNNYTGTDYSGIEALRREIKEQEQLVKARRVAVDEAKQALDEAHALQGSSQKEVVGLLERKHSWSATDLERYMSLIRSEHLNDQAIHTAKDKLLASETALEEARTHLEKRERAQYHEEQIWSDTIRRNSTWVTFGLMGVNIFLLLANLVIFEPWRRRRIIREINKTLEAQKAVAWPPSASLATQSVEAAIDTVVEPAGVALESLKEPDTPIQESEAPFTAEQTVLAEAEAEAEAVSVPPTESPMAANIIEVDIAPEVESVETRVEAGETVVPTTLSISLSAWQQTISEAFQLYREYFRDLFSERSISVRKVDLTAAALEGAAVGAVLMSLLLVLVRPR